VFRGSYTRPHLNKEHVHNRLFDTEEALDKKLLAVFKRKKFSTTDFNPDFAVGVVARRRKPK
jgi:hypothetical protein